MANSNPPVKNTAFDLYCFIAKTDGTIIANPGGLASRICKDGDAGAAGPAPSVVDSTGGTVKLSLTNTNMNADCITVKITSTDTGAIPALFTIYTSGQTLNAIATVFTGITSLASWLRGFLRKDAMDATAKTEINSGGGTYNEATDSNEAIRDTAPMGTAMRGTDNAALDATAAKDATVAKDASVAKDATVMKTASYTAPDNAGIAAIKTQTDKMAFTSANKIDARVREQDNIDFGALQKTSLNAATPAVTVSDKTGFSLSSAGILAIWNQLTADAGLIASSFGMKLKNWVLGSDNKALISTDAQDLSATLKVDAKVVEDKAGYTASVSDKTGFSLVVTPPTAAQIRSEMDANSIKLAGAALETTAQNIKGKTDQLIFVDQRVNANASLTLTPEDIQAIADGVNSGVTGLYRITVSVCVIGTTTPVPGYAISIYDDSDSVFMGKVITDPSGVVSFNVNAGTYKIRGAKVGYVAENASETLVVAGDTPVTYFAAAYEIPAPTGMNVCRVFEWALMPDLTPMDLVTGIASVETPYDYSGALLAGNDIEPVYDPATGLLYWDIAWGAKVEFFVKELHNWPIHKTVPNAATIRLQDM